MGGGAGAGVDFGGGDVAAGVAVEVGVGEDCCRQIQRVLREA